MPAGQVQALEHELDRGGDLARAVASSPCPSRSSTLARPGTVPTWSSSSVGRDQLAGLDGRALGEQLGEAGQVEPGQPVAERLGDRHAAAGAARTSASRPSSPISNSSLPRSVGTTVGRSHDPRHRGRPRRSRAARRSADAATASAAAIANRARDAGALVDRRGLAQRRGSNRATTSSRCSGTSATSVRLLRDAARPRRSTSVGVVRADLGAEPVLQRGDDPAAVGVVLGVGAGDEQHVERQPQRVAADLDVALLQHVEQRDLDPLGEVGQLVDAEDAAVGARDAGRSGRSRGRRACGPRRP